MKQVKQNKLNMEIMFLFSKLPHWKEVSIEKKVWPLKIINTDGVTLMMRILRDY